MSNLWLRVTKSSDLRTILLVALCGWFVGCSTTSEVETDPVAAAKKEQKHEEYNQLVESFTRQAYLYSGLINVFQLHATILNEEIVVRQLRFLADQYGWTDSNYRTERDKAAVKTKEATDFFLSFFASETVYNGLDETKSVWKIYLETNGQRIEGTVKKWKAPAPEIESIFPFFTRWHSPYRITFAIPTSQVQGTSSRLIIQGPLGAQVLDFPGVVYTGASENSEGANGVTF